MKISLMQKGCNQTLRIQSCFEHFVTKFLKRIQDIWGQAQKGLPKHDLKTRHSFPLTSRNHRKKTFQLNNEQCNLCSQANKWTKWTRKTLETWTLNQPKRKRQSTRDDSPRKETDSINRVMSREACNQEIDARS